MKKIILGLLILTLFLSGCIFNKEELKSNTKEVATTLAPLREYLSTTETIMGLARGKKIDKIPQNKTVNTENIPDLDGKTPDEVYKEYGGDGKNEIRVPNSGYIDNFYGEGSNIRAAFYMTPTTLTDDSTGYIIDLYMEPYLDLSVDYDYEKYKITHDSWEFKLENLLDYKTYLSDGSIANREIIEQKDDWNSDVGYAMFDVPEVLNNLDLYLYPDTIPQPATTTGIGWYSHTKSEIQNFFRDIVAEEFYTESSTDMYINSGVTYIKTKSDMLWDTKTKTVVRFERNGHFQSTKAFTTTGNIGSTWYSALDDVTIDSTGSNNDLTHYKKTFMEWWKDPENIRSDNFSYKEIIEMDEKGKDTAEYEGTIKEFWNGRTTGNGYHVSLVKDNNDNYIFTIDWQWFEATDKAFNKSIIKSENSNPIKSFKIVDNNLVIELNGGIFRGHFCNGVFTGEFEFKDKIYKDVVIDTFGIKIGKDKFRFDKNGNIIE